MGWVGTDAWGVSPAWGEHTGSVTGTDTAAATEAGTVTVSTPPPTVVPVPPGGLILRVYDRTHTTLLGLLPDFAAGMSAQQEFDAEGVLTLSYLPTGLNRSLLDSDDALLTIVQGGVERTDWYVLEDDGEDPAAATGTQSVDVGCRGNLSYLERAIVYPSAHTPGADLSGMEPLFKFTAATPGAILNTLLDRAHARGAITWVTAGFSNTADSNGTAWNTAYDVTFDMGVDLMKAVQGMCDNGWCDVRMVGNTVMLYLPDQMGIDRPTTILRLGQQVTSGPRKRTRRPIRSHMVGLGDEGVIAEAANTTALTRYGRREGFEQQGGIAATATLLAVVTARLFLVSSASEGFTVECALDGGGPQPGVDYFVADTVRYDARRLDSTNLEPMRVRSIADTWTNNGARSSSVEFNDLFMEASLRLARRLDGIVNGSTASGTIPTPPPTFDSTVPKAPTVPTVTSFGSVDITGHSTADVVVAWAAVTQNLDNSAITDLGGYEVQWKKTAVTTWISGADVSASPAGIPNVPVSTAINVRVRAYDLSGNKSDWSPTATHTTLADVSGPPTPATPVLSTRLGVIHVYWNGLGSANQTMPADFRWVEVHMSITNNFTPTTATVIGFLTGAGPLLVADQTYNSVRYFKLIAVDNLGNKSAASAQASISTTPLVNTDVIGQIISGANIVDGTLVASDKIVANSITGALIQALTIQAGDLAANSVTADKVVSGSITADLLAIGVTTNILKDPSLVDTVLRGQRATAMPTGFSIQNPPAEYPAIYFIRSAVTTGTTTGYYWDSPIPSGAGHVDRVHVLFRHNATANGVARVALRFTLADGTTTLPVPIEVDVTDIPADTWVAFDGTAYAPTGAVAVQMRYETAGQTAGTWDFILPEMAVVWGVIQSSNYLEGTAGFRFSDNDSQVSNLNVLDTIGASVVNADSLTLAGDDMVTILDGKSQGAAAYGKLLTTVHSASIGSTNTRMITFSAGTLKGSHSYAIVARGHMTGNTPGDAFDLELHYTRNGNTPYSTDPILDGSLTRVYLGNAPGAQYHVQGELDIAVGIDEVVKVSMYMDRIAGSGTAYLWLTDANRSFQVLVTDLGLTDNIVGTISQISKAGATPPPPDPDPVSTYTHTWTDQWVRSYDGDGGTRMGDDTSAELYQGYVSSTHGNTRSLFGLDYADVQYRLAGATIKKITLTFKVKHAYQNAGLDVRISSHDYTAKPSTWSSSRVNNAVATRANAIEGSTYTVTLPDGQGTNLKNGTTKGFGFGPATDNGTSQYGYMYATGLSVTIVYSK